jgi:hypothetical protein
MFSTTSRRISLTVLTWLAVLALLLEYDDFDEVFPLCNSSQYSHLEMFWYSFNTTKNS